MSTSGPLVWKLGPCNCSQKTHVFLWVGRERWWCMRLKLTSIPWHHVRTLLYIKNIGHSCFLLHCTQSTFKILKLTTHLSQPVNFTRKDVNFGLHTPPCSSSCCFPSKERVCVFVFVLQWTRRIDTLGCCVGGWQVSREMNTSTVYLQYHEHTTSLLLAHISQRNLLIW